MISLSHFNNGNRIALNTDLIEKVEATPDTVITLTNGARYLVQESIDEIIEKTAQSQAYVMHLARHMSENPAARHLRLLHGEADSLDEETPQ